MDCKKSLRSVLVAVLMISCSYSYAQVSVGTISPDASAQLELNSTTKGFLPPRMTTAQRDAISSPAAGLVIYNTTTNRLEVRQASGWLSLSSLAGSETLTNKTISGSNNTISNVNLASQVTGTLPVANGGTGVIGSTGSGNNVLSNSPTLTTPIISTTTNTSDAGAVRYNTTSGGVLQYSNGTAWNTLGSTVQKSLVAGYFNASSYSSGYYGNLTATENIDVNGDFTSNTFTVPRTGNYTFTATVSTDKTAVTAGGTWELQVVPSSGVAYVSRFMVPTSVSATPGINVSVTGAYTVQLTAGTTVTFKLYNSLGFSKTLDVENYNRFSIVEN